MRPVLHGDVSSAARALLPVQPELRARLCRKLIREAEMADEFVLKYGKLHPVFGNGSLMASARKRQLVPEPDFDNSDYCECFVVVLNELLALRSLEDGSVELM